MDELNFSNQNNDVVAVVMAGGQGTRFWPLSRPNRPKQFLTLWGEKSLLEITMDRVLPLVSSQNLYLCTQENFRGEIERIQKKTEVLSQNVIYEPEGRNTAPCLMLSLLSLLRQGTPRSHIMLVFPADHSIKKNTPFLESIQKGIAFLRKRSGMMTLGIKPEFPHIGYGYMEAGEKIEEDFFLVRRFTEKPSREMAEKFLLKGNYFWNAGIFIWTLGALEGAFEKWLSQEWQWLKAAKNEKELQERYSSLRSQPIDTAVLEKQESLFLQPVSFGWSDVGSWGALYDLLSKNKEDNLCLQGQVQTVESRHNLICVPPARKVSLVGVENLIIVEEGEDLLITTHKNDQLIKKIHEKT